MTGKPGFTCDYCGGSGSLEAIHGRVACVACLGAGATAPGAIAGDALNAYLDEPCSVKDEIVQLAKQIQLKRADPTWLPLKVFWSRTASGDEQVELAEKEETLFTVGITPEGDFAIEAKTHYYREGCVRPWFVEGRWGGSRDVPLSSLGEITMHFDFHAADWWGNGSNKCYSNYLGAGGLGHRKNLTLTRTHSKGRGLLELLKVVLANPDAHLSRIRATIPGPTKAPVGLENRATTGAQVVGQALRPAGHALGHVAEGTGWPVGSRNGLGIAALVCGLAGITFLPVFAPIAAVLLGHMGQHACRKGAASNRAMSIAGTVLGYVGVVVAVVWAVVVVVAMNQSAVLVR